MKRVVIKKSIIVGSLISILITLSVNAQNVKDFDGNVYGTAKLGTQVWTSSNLNVSHFRNGDLIPQAQTPEEWAEAASSGKPAWCYYDNKAEHGRMYGKLYNWYAIYDPRGLAPAGWSIPENNDWRTLVKNLKGVDMAGTSLKSTTGWKTKKGTNDIGFAGIPGGYREQDGKFRDIGKIGQWWSNSVPVDVKPSNKIYTIMLDDNSVEVKYKQSEKGAGYSVRCKKT